jgi:predicted phosphodiesterase
MSPPTHQPIGIMADSHGDPRVIDRGTRFLRRRGCTLLYHLGDICDTNHFDTADACVDRVKKHGIVAVKGNNDHSLAVDARGRPNTAIRRETLSFLENLPLSLTVDRATLVHSQPFVRRLGLSAMIGTIGRRDAGHYFKEHPGGFLLRGHSHTPEMICRRDGEIQFLSLQDGQTLALEEYRPCIVTCGALTAGFVMIWEPGEDRLACCSFKSTQPEC